MKKLVLLLFILSLPLLSHATCNSNKLSAGTASQGGTYTFTFSGVAGCYLVLTQLNLTSYGNSSEPSYFEVIEGSSCGSSGLLLWNTYLAPPDNNWTAPQGWLIAAINTGDNMCVNVFPGTGTTHISIAATYYYTATHP